MYPLSRQYHSAFRVMELMGQCSKGIFGYFYMLLETVTQCVMRRMERRLSTTNVYCLKIVKKQASKRPKFRSGFVSDRGALGIIRVWSSGCEHWICKGCSISRVRLDQIYVGLQRFEPLQKKRCYFLEYLSLLSLKIKI